MLLFSYLSSDSSISVCFFRCNVCDKSINNKSEAEKHIKQLPKCSNLPGLMKAIEKLSDDDDRLNNGCR